MAGNNINAYCAICGKGYHICNSCMGQRSFKSWRTVTDSVAHYKIYLVLHDYIISGNKEKAKAGLEKCGLFDIRNLKPEIVKVIREIGEI